jgi:hypothetical protein
VEFVEVEKGQVAIVAAAASVQGLMKRAISRQAQISGIE